MPRTREEPKRSHYGQKYTRQYTDLYLVLVILIVIAALFLAAILTNGREILPHEKQTPQTYYPEMFDPK